MKLFLIFVSLALLVVVSGCTQTGYTVERETITIQEESEPDEETETIETPQAGGEEEGLCEKVFCQEFSATCPDDFVATCQSVCDPYTGECIDCAPSCLGHDLAQDPCEGIVCEDSAVECPDGFQASCPNSCSGGSCSSCQPDCSEHPCIENWVCGGWSDCVEGQQTRTCTDENNCGTEEDRPADIQSCEAGTDHLLFSEVYYDAETPESEKEWFELYNPTSVPLDLTGWSVSDNQYTRALPNGTVIEPESYLTIARNTAGFHELYNCDPDIVLIPWVPLSNSGDSLTLYNDDGVEIDFVAWEGGDPNWEDVEADDGKSIQRSPVNQDTDSPSDWLSNQQPDPDC